MRSPAVAGAFYPGTKEECERMLSGFQSRCKTDFAGDVVSCVVPHAGWVYSGFTAMHSFAALKQTCVGKKVKKPVFVILCPNHSGCGAEVAVSTENWLTPLGEAKCSQKTVAAVINSSEFVSADDAAHAREHSAEVQLPFLQFLFGKDFEFVAIALMRQELEVATDLAKATAVAAKNLRQPVFMIASSDLTHYEPARQAKAKDEYCLEAVLKLDAAGFMKRVEERDVSACGPCAIAASIEYALLNGAKEASVLHFSNSGAVSCNARVVDYASAVFF
ncbi:TPA: AmmeMemoRadiSam system protein B [Candidatus Micrarchaeota archaeon]|nr:MAG: AmmeMemoRadiSam system protein B [Candidatus Micrarchaeota archaeon CG1_02_51_15]HII38512.1 AmmeMemoRadiSam system protein B [Candidatus Micrarchaeota archaeon]